MVADLTYAYAADITKAERDAQGDLIVYGKATGPDLDLDEQVCDPEWLKSAMPAWAEFSNIREMHQPICAGVGMVTENSGDDWFVKSKVIDDQTAKKIEAGGLKGYSIGIKAPKVVKDAKAPGGRIVGGQIVEISYVDRPCNPDATMTICKMVGADNTLSPVEADTDEMTIKVGSSVFSPTDLAKLLATKKELEADVAKSTKDDDEDDDGQDGADGADDDQDDDESDDDGKLKKETKTKEKVKAAVDESGNPQSIRADPADTIVLAALVKQYGLTPEQAEKVPAWLRPVVLKGADTAAKGAMPPLKPGGKPRYPISNVQDLEDAIRSFGRGKPADKDEIQAHIKSEAKRLGRTDLVPDDWKSTDADLAKADGDDQTHDSDDIAAVRDGLVALINAELQELCDGEPELCDIEQLLCSLRMLMSWWSSEAAGGETESPYDTGGTDMAYVGLGADADATKIESSVDTTSIDAGTGKDAAPDATKTTAPDGAVDENRLIELVKSAKADLEKVFEERIAALEATNETLKTDLDKALALPEPGGPVITRTIAQAVSAKIADVAVMKAEADALIAKALEVQRTDPRLAAGYRERAAEILKNAA